MAVQVKALSALSNSPTVTESGFTTSALVVVGRPDAPVQVAVDVDPPVPGRATLSWEAVESNAIISTTYTALVFKTPEAAAAGTPVYTSVLLTASPGTAVAGKHPFSQEVVLPAGRWHLTIATANTRGAGLTSAPVGPFDIGKWPGQSNA